jgi:hypothetical protein
LAGERPVREIGEDERAEEGGAGADRDGKQCERERPQRPPDLEITLCKRPAREQRPAS